MSFVIYMITRNDGQKYIGKTKSTRVSQRMYEHSISDRFSDHTFEYIILEEVETDIEVKERERFYIQKYDTYHNGLNESSDGTGNRHAPNFTTLGYRFSEASRVKMSEARQKYFERLKQEGKDPPNKGKPGKKLTEQQRLNRKLVAKKRAHLYWKLSDNQVVLIRKRYDNNIEHDLISKCGQNGPNGRPLTYARLWAKRYAAEYGVTITCLHNIITHKMRNDIGLEG